MAETARASVELVIEKESNKQHVARVAEVEEDLKGFQLSVTSFRKKRTN